MVTGPGINPYPDPGINMLKVSRKTDDFVQCKISGQSSNLASIKWIILMNLYSECENGAYFCV